MDRQIQIGGVFFNLSTTREYQVSWLYVNEEDAAGGGGTLRRYTLTTLGVG
jgi:hypothetical protein